MRGEYTVSYTSRAIIEHLVWSPAAPWQSLFPSAQ